MSIDVEAYVRELRQLVTAAALNYDIWWVYKDEETRPKFTKTMNKYNLFFHSSIHAHFVALLVALYALYETRTNTYNIPILLSALHGQISETALDEATAIYARAKPLWIKVSILRNKAFGHRSNAHTVEEAFAEAAVTPNELRDLVDLTKELLNCISHAVFNSVHAFNLNAREPTIGMLEKLHKSHENL